MKPTILSLFEGLYGELYQVEHSCLASTPIEYQMKMWKKLATCLYCNGWDPHMIVTWELCKFGQTT